MLDGGECFALIDKLCGHDIAVTNKLTVNILLFKHNTECIAMTQFHRKIDVPAENTGQIHNLVVAQSGGYRGFPEAGVDIALGKIVASFYFFAFQVGLHFAVCIGGSDYQRIFG